MLSKRGLMGVADFYVSHKYSPSDPLRQHYYWTRWFWQWWFDLDNVYLHPSRREYLEHRFVTVKTMSGWNRFIGRFVQIPFYIWVSQK